MKILFQIIAFNITVSLFYGCVSYGNNTETSFNKLNNVNCIKRSDKIHVFFEGEPIDFEYQKIGIVESVGGEYSTDEEILNQLKYSALNNCADGIISVSTGYKNRVIGTTFVEGSEQNYNSKYYHGIAIKINMDSTFIEKYGNGEFKENFVPQVEQKLNSEQDWTVFQVTASTIGLIVIIIAAFVATS